MPKVITLTNAVVRKIDITNYANDGYFQVQVTYHLIDDQTVEWSIKEMIRFSSGSGLSSEQLLPAAWETVFQTLINDINTKMTTLEGLN